MITSRLIDTHSHLLPGLDHGCPDMQTSLEMALAAATSGVQIVACTPHLTEWDPDLIVSARDTATAVRDVLAREGIELELRLGFEVDVSLLVGAPYDRLRELTLEGTPGVLVIETPYHGWPFYLEEIVFDLASRGFTPVLAHPERNDRVQRDPSLLARCRRAGALVQATAGSLGEPFGKEAERCFFRLVALELVDLVASDAHWFRREDWTMERMLILLEKWVGAEDLLTLAYANPLRLVSGD
ncbi:MAG: hypothetical protein N3B14_09465 [Thermoleophilia bacterium]|nr:hypothetical protein [Thermoleophilia bacterium]